MKGGRLGAWLGVAAWHGLLAAALAVAMEPGHRELASRASPVAVRLLPPLPLARADGPALAPAHDWRPSASAPALLPVAPPEFVVEADPPSDAAPAIAVMATATPSPALPPAPAPARWAPEAREAEPVQPARRAACAPAPHPLPLRERGIEGVVRLRVWVDELGRAGQVLLASSSGWRLFDDAAMAQARRCPFHPAQRGAQPVGSWVEFPVRFALETSNG
jgi:protein TonB